MLDTLCSGWKRSDSISIIYAWVCGDALRSISNVRDYLHKHAKTWHHWIWPLRRKCNCSQKRSMFIALNSFNIWFKCKLVYASSQGLAFQDLLFFNCWQPSPAKSIKQILRCQGGFRAATTRITRPGVQEKGRKAGALTWPSPGKPACWLHRLLAGFSASPLASLAGLYGAARAILSGGKVEETFNSPSHSRPK